MAKQDDIELQVKKALSARLKNTLEKGITGEYVEKIRDRIVQRTRLGVGVDPETGASQRLKPLAEITKRVRAGQARVFSTKTGGKLVWTDGTFTQEGKTDKTVSPAARQRRKESFQAFFGKPRLSDLTTPAKSNLTATGQLLNSLTVVKVKLENGVQYVIRVGDRRGLGLYGEPSKIGNKKLVEYLAEGGRKFLGITKSQRNEISREIRELILKFIKNP